MKTTYLRLGTLVLVATGALVLAGLVGGGQEAPPPAPEWLDGTGKVIPEKLPERVFVAGPDGELVRCGNGELLQVKPGGEPPPFRPLRGVLPAQIQSDEPFVPRCGSGPNGHLNPISVPVSQDPLRK